MGGSEKGSRQASDFLFLAVSFNPCGNVERSVNHYLQVGTRSKNIEKNTMFVRMLATVKTAHRIAIAMRKKANVEKNWASLSPSSSCPVVEYRPYAP